MTKWEERSGPWEAERQARGPVAEGRHLSPRERGCDGKWRSGAGYGTRSRNGAAR